MLKSMKQDVTTDKLDAYWVRTLRQAVATGECKTVCSCADVRVQTNEGLVAAVLVRVEHVGSF
jgi:hypothetical protein